MIWRCRDRAFDLERRTLVMGVLNVTPDSFSDGGRFLEPAAALTRAREMLDEGADLIDVGAESTRPGAAPVPADEQLARLAPVVEALAGEPRATLSIDTADARVAERALALGAHVVNDVSALGDPAMARVVAASGAGLVLMHMQGVPRPMQDDPRYEDVAREVRDFLAARLEAAVAAGVAAERIALDPGIGFGKSVAHNLTLLARQRELLTLGQPLLVGWSRKSTLGAVTGRPVEERLAASVAAALLALERGAHVVRVHDVAATVDALKLWQAMKHEEAHTT